MPFGPLFTPSIALSLLKPALTQRGFSVSTHYFLIDYAQRVGLRFYSGIARSTQLPLAKLPGEWIFSGQVFDANAHDVNAYVEEVLRSHGERNRRELPVPKRLITRLLDAHADAASYLDECAERLLRDAPRVVGFTTTFQQHMGSLALAKRIKAARPDTFIILGGANCEGVMGAETVRQFPFVDATLSGEGDFAFPEVVRRVLHGESLEGMAGLRTRASIERDFAEHHFDNTPAVLDLDALPESDFTDYLAQFKRSRFSRTWQPRLMYETSRGCWWGERSHCTFCGLNGSTMRYRSKSPARAIGELQSLMERYPGHDIDVADNILDLGYFDTVLPELARRKTGIALFYETKSNLKKEQVRLLRDAGITRIQPGIESLSDAVLKLMRKGVSGLQNIQLLKWCRELGLSAPWNLLSGFPGEPASEYARMTEMVPLLAHLQPPEYLAPIRMDRFSPNFFDAERLGFKNLAPFEAYRHVYRGLSAEAIQNLAYYFDFDYREPQVPEEYTDALAAAVQEWHAAHARSALFSVDTADHLIVWDLRPIAKQFLTVLSGMERRLLLACDAVANVRQLATALGIREDDVRAHATSLVERGFVLRDGERLLALTIPLGEYSPPPVIVDRFQRIARSVGERSSTGIAIPWNAKPVDVLDSHRPQGREPRPLTPSRFAVDRNFVVLH